MINQNNTLDIEKLKVVEIDGKIWFDAAECANALGYDDVLKAVRKHCPNAIIVESDTMISALDLNGRMSCYSSPRLLISNLDLTNLILKSSPLQRATYSTNNNKGNSSWTKQ